MLLGDLIGVRAFPAVVQAADVRALRTEKALLDIRDFVTGYLGFDARSRHALDTAIASLSQTQRGGAFFLNGVFGSGKSHLLGLLALLADGVGVEAFAATHPQLAKKLEGAPSRLVVHFSLDDYSPAELSLEEIVHLEITREWQQRFNEKLELPRADLRREYFGALDERLLERDCQGLLLCIDELSLFLSAKEHTALQADAAFLQFIGQKAARSSACPTHVFAAIQKTIDDIGNIEAYSLSQIRDRFQTLPLSLAHLPSLISLRLIIHKDPGALQQLCRERYAALCKALPRLDFAQKEWETLFPFHPTTVTLLEKVVARFFSRTRSAALFCASAAQELLSAPVEQAEVLPEKVFDYFRMELESHPELHPLLNVWEQWKQEATELGSDAAETQTLLRLMKTLLLFKIAGTAPTATQLAHALTLDMRLPDEGNYEYVSILLERILSRGSHLAVERQEPSGEKVRFSDRYTIDLGTRVSELARRHLRNSISQLRLDDARIPASLLAACHSEPIPLKTLTEERLFPIHWKHSPREIAVQLLHSLPSPDFLTNRIGMLGTGGEHAELLLLVLAPLSSQASRRRQPLPQSPRYLIWSPRLPTADELQSAREATAANLLESDPQLLDNRRGRAVVQYLKDSRPQREAQMAHLSWRLLHEGTFWFGDGRVLEASESALGECWQESLEALADLAFPQIFPKFEAIAPRARTLTSGTSGNIQQLGLELLRRPDTDPYFPVSLDRLVRTLAHPIGVAAAEKGRWRISSPSPELSRELREQIGEESTLRALESHFAQSEWGLLKEQLHLALCALLRDGQLTASNPQGKVLAPERIGFPLERSVHKLHPGHLLEHAAWEQLHARLRILEISTEDKPDRLTFARQQQVKKSLLQKRAELEAESELMQARLRQLQRALGHSPSQWPAAESTLQEMAALLEKLQAPQETVPFLETIAALEETALSRSLTQWQKLRDRFEAHLSELLETHRLLKHPRLSAPSSLQEQRDRILQSFEYGETVLEDAKLLETAGQWRAEYFVSYRDWHTAQHNPARWNSLRRLQNSDSLQSLIRLGALQSRSFTKHQQIQRELQTELAKLCPRDGALLPGEATCNACDLRYGERIELSEPRSIEAMITNEIALFHRLLQEKELRARLRHEAKSTSLLEWNGEADQLAPLIDDKTLAALDAALKPRRQVPRNLQHLTGELSRCRTRAELEAAFQNWLNGNEYPESDDEILLQ